MNYLTEKDYNHNLTGKAEQQQREFFWKHNEKIFNDELNSLNKKIFQSLQTLKNLEDYTNKKIIH